MKIHLIALGGSAMHNLAIALHNKGLTMVLMTQFLIQVKTD